MHFLPALTLLLSAAPLASANGGPFTINVSEVKGPLDGETDELVCFSDDAGANSAELRETTENLQCVLTITRWLDLNAALGAKPDKKKEPMFSMSADFNATFGPCKVLLGMSGGTLKSDLLRMQKAKPAPNP